MTKQETDKYIKIGLVIVAVIVVLYILSQFSEGLKSVFESLGLKSSEAEKKTIKEIEAAETKGDKPQPPQSEWTPKDFNYLQPDASIQNLNKWVATQRANKKPVRAVTFLPGYFKNNAQKIYDSVGYIYDDPEQGLAIIKGLRTKASIAYLQKDFATLTGKDMFTWLRTKYDTERQKEVLNNMFKYIDALPVGVISTTNNKIIQ